MVAIFASIPAFAAFRAAEVRMTKSIGGDEVDGVTAGALGRKQAVVGRVVFVVVVPFAELGDGIEVGSDEDGMYADDEVGANILL